MKFRETIWNLLGFISLALGVIGIFLPLLPTTPFLLLSAFCWSRGSEKFHHWLTHHRVLGPPIENWQKNRAIPLKVKFVATGMMLLTAAFVLTHPRIPGMGQILYAAILSTVLIFIWTRKNS